MIKKVLISTLCLTALAACDTAKEQMGLTKTAPDEFQVVKRAPLTLPPSYTLRPPQPGAPRPQEQSPDVAAAQTVFGEDAPREQASVITDGESALVQRAGGSVADPNIRQRVDSETASLHDRNKPVAEKLLGIGGSRTDPSATVLDAKGEAERLNKNTEEGKPVTEGETPSFEE